MKRTDGYSRQTIAKAYAAFLVFALLAGAYFLHQPIIAGIKAIPSMSAWNLTGALFLRLVGIGLLLGAILSIELGRTVNWLTIVLWWFMDYDPVEWQEKPIRFVLGVAALTGMGFFGIFAGLF